MYKTNKRNQQKDGEKEDGSETSRPRNDTAISSLGFLLLCMYQTWRQEAGNPGTPISADRSLQESLISSKKKKKRKRKQKNVRQ